MVTVEVSDGQGNVVTTETRPDQPPNAEQLAVRNAIVAITPANVTSLATARVEIATIKVALARLAKYVASIEEIT